MRVSDVDEAVRIANDSEYGLQASVWTKDVEKGEAIARRLRGRGGVASTTPSSTTRSSTPRWAAGRPRASARATAPRGIRKYCKTQTILLAHFSPKKDLHMFPYKPTVSKMLGRTIKMLYGR